MRFPSIVIAVFKDQMQSFTCATDEELRATIHTIETGEHVLEYSLFECVAKKVRKTSFVDSEE